MDERILKLLFDVKKAINEIDGFFDDFPLSFDHYRKNIILKRAVERSLKLLERPLMEF